MLLDFIEGSANLDHSVTGGERTFEQYVGRVLDITREQDLEMLAGDIESSVPPEHLEFFHALPYYYEDDYAIYVALPVSIAPSIARHCAAGACCGCATWSLQKLPWQALYLRPTRRRPLLPLWGVWAVMEFTFPQRHASIPVTNLQSPLSCLSLPDFALYQSFADGHEETHHITSFIPESIKAMQKRRARRIICLLQYTNRKPTSICRRKQSGGLQDSSRWSKRSADHR